MRALTTSYRSTFSAARAQGRAIDRFGAPRVLVPLLAVHLTLLLAFVFGVTHGWSDLAIITLTVGWGGTQPVLMSSLRALWGTLFSGAERDSAFAMQAVLTEVVFFLGPLVATGATLLISPAAAMVYAAVLTFWGVLIFAATVRSRQAEADEPGAIDHRRVWIAALRSRRLKLLALIAGLTGVMSGAVEILLPVFAEHSGLTARAGIGFAVLALGSIVGGLLYGSRTWSGPTTTRFAWLVAALGLALLPLVLTPAFALVCAVLFVAGMPIAPSEACLYSLVDDDAGDATVVEANSWVVAAYTAGLGVGTAAGGQLVSHASLAAASAIPAAAALVAASMIALLLRRRGGAPGPPTRTVAHAKKGGLVPTLTHGGQNPWSVDTPWR